MTANYFRYGGTVLTGRQYSLAQFFTIFAAVIFGGQATSKLFSFSHSVYLKRTSLKGFSVTVLRLH